MSSPTLDLANLNQQYAFVQEKAKKDGIAKLCINPVILDPEGKVLVVKRASHNPRRPNLWCLTGGKVEEGETIIDTLIRETQEELGLEIVTIKQKLSTEWDSLVPADWDLNANRQWRVVYFLVEAKGEVKLSQEELSEYAFISQEEIPNYFTTEELDPKSEFYRGGELKVWEEVKSLNSQNRKETKTLTFEELMTKMSDSSQGIRDLAASKFNQILKKYEKVAEHELNAILQHKKIMDELRRYPRPDSARLASDDITPEVVDTLLSAVQSQLQISRDYYTLKAQLLGKEKLQYHERNVEYGKVVQTYTFEQGVAILRRVFKKLDDSSTNLAENETEKTTKKVENNQLKVQNSESTKSPEQVVSQAQTNSFSAILEDYLANGKIDVFPRVGKRGGAFMTGSTGRQIDPTFIFLNWTGTLNDVQTFAHEMGHACNYEMMKVTSTALDWEASHLTAESPSTFMEDFVLEEILEDVDNDEEKLTILMKKLNDDISSIFRQISLYLFEQELHTTFRQKGYLSSQEIGVLFQKHMFNYMGDSVAKSEGSENWWIYWSHIRMMFYVYSYGAGLLISKFMQSQLRADPGFISQIKKFYAAGLSQTPVAILQETLGIDATSPEIWLKGLEQTGNNLKLAKELAGKLGLIK